jgi:hypothetical protein
MHWFAQLLGLNSPTGHAYAWWSGAGSDLGELAIIGGLVAAYRKHTCHVHRCWRFARHRVEGTPYVCCAKHHPDVPARVTHNHIIEEARRNE